MVAAKVRVVAAVVPGAGGAAETEAKDSETRADSRAKRLVQLGEVVDAPFDDVAEPVLRSTAEPCRTKKRGDKAR